LTKKYHASSEITVVITTNFQLPQFSKNDEKLPRYRSNEINTTSGQTGPEGGAASQNSVFIGQKMSLTG
jgi:hypothetical protein